MNLVHYSEHPVTAVRSMRGTAAFKPRGLWVSDEDDRYSWRWWCEKHQYHLERLRFTYDVLLSPKAKILAVSSLDGLGDFTSCYGYDLEKYGVTYRLIDWRKVRKEFQGILLVLDIWEDRMGCGRALGGREWYSHWDCNGGVIWHARAIQSISLRS